MTGPPGNDDASDAFAAWIFNGEVHAEIENLAGRSTYPVLDCEREYTDHVIEDFGVIEAHHEPTDEFRALPVRITYGSLTDYQIELGEYDLGARQIDVLRRALVAYYRITAGQPQ
jgi:hypothetical protein